MTIGYNMDDAARFQAYGNELKRLLLDRCPHDHWHGVQYAHTVAREVLGFLPMDDGHVKMSDDAIKAGIPNVEMMLVVLRTLDALKAHR